MQEKQASTNFVLLSQSRNVTEKFIKFYLKRPIKVLQFPTSGRIKKCLSQLQNILVFLTIPHLQVELCTERTVVYVISVCIIV